MDRPEFRYADDRAVTGAGRATVSRVADRTHDIALFAVLFIIGTLLLGLALMPDKPQMVAPKFTLRVDPGPTNVAVRTEARR